MTSYGGEGDLTALFLTYWHWRRRRRDPLWVRPGICGICGQLLEAAGGTSSGRRPRPSLSLSLSLWFSGTLVSITHSLITAGRSLEASSFCQHPVECAPRISLWAASGDARVIDAKRRRSLAAEICGPRGMRNLVFFFCWISKLCSVCLACFSSLCDWM